MAEALRAVSPKILKKILGILKFLFARFWAGRKGAESRCLNAGVPQVVTNQAQVSRHIVAASGLQQTINSAE